MKCSSRQKWYNGYEEALRVPLLISHPTKITPKKFEFPTSSTDLLPTMLGLVGVKPESLYPVLRQTHSHVEPLVGSDLSLLILEQEGQRTLGSSINERELFRRVAYSQTRDDPFRGDRPISLAAKNYPFSLWFYHFELNPVQGPVSIEVVVQYLPLPPNSFLGKNHQKYALFKLVRFWDDPGTWKEPFRRDETKLREGRERGKKVVKTEPLPDEFEMYNLSEDPFETRNLALPSVLGGSPQLLEIKELLWRQMQEERKRRALSPSQPLPSSKRPPFVFHVTKKDLIKVPRSRL